jgi:hypothetical protein
VLFLALEIWGSEATRASIITMSVHDSNTHRSTHGSNTHNSMHALEATEHEKTKEKSYIVASSPEGYP